MMMAMDAQVTHQRRLPEVKSGCQGVHSRARRHPFRCELLTAALGAFGAIRDLLPLSTRFLRGAIARSGKNRQRGFAPSEPARSLIWVLVKECIDSASCDSGSVYGAMRDRVWPGLKNPEAQTSVLGTATPATTLAASLSLRLQKMYSPAGMAGTTKCSPGIGG